MHGGYPRHYNRTSDHLLRDAFFFGCLQLDVLFLPLPPAFHPDCEPSLLPRLLAMMICCIHMNIKSSMNKIICDNNISIGLNTMTIEIVL